MTTHTTNKFRRALLSAENELFHEAKENQLQENAPVPFSKDFERKMNRMVIKQANPIKFTRHLSKFVACIMAVILVSGFVLSFEMSQFLTAGEAVAGDLRWIDEKTGSPIPSARYYDWRVDEKPPAIPQSEIDKDYPIFHSNDRFYVEDAKAMNYTPKGEKRLQYYLRKGEVMPAMALERHPLNAGFGFGYMTNEDKSLFYVKTKFTQINGYEATQVLTNFGIDWVWRDEYFMYCFSLSKKEWGERHEEYVVPIEEAFDMMENSGFIESGSFRDLKETPYYIIGRNKRGETIYEEVN